MALKDFWKGKSGLALALNVVLMVAVVVAVPAVAFQLLDGFTHHGEKIEVPSVVGKSLPLAESMLKDRGLKAVVSDSAYDKHMAPGAVLAQSPDAGYEVKGGRVVYLTMNLHGVPTVEMPSVVGKGTLRETVALLESLGFRLTPHEYVMGQPKDLVLAVRQGRRELQAGQLVPRDKALTIVVGGGEVDSTLIEDEVYEDGELPPDFDIEL